MLEKLGFVIENNQKKYRLVITADNVTSTDENFTMENLELGNNYTALDTYYKSSREELIRRKRNKGEKKISNQTMPRLACQIFEESIAALSVEEKENFSSGTIFPMMRTEVSAPTFSMAIPKRALKK